MSFEESYLIPKSLYEKLQKPAPEPSDVTLKKKYFAVRFQLQKLPRTQLQNPPDLILDAIEDEAKRSLAKQILNFIQTHGGGTIKWGEDLVLTINGFRMEELDAREVIRQLVGEIADFNQQAYPVYEQLKLLGAPEHLLRFYSTKVDKWSPLAP